MDAGATERQSRPNLAAVAALESADAAYAKGDYKEAANRYGRAALFADTGLGKARMGAAWAAVVARDASADGRFFYSVRTTGVYCRPSCASRPAPTWSATARAPSFPSWMPSAAWM